MISTYRNDRIFDPRDPRLVASVATTRDAQAQARRHERTHEDSSDFRDMRAMMRGNRGVL